MVLERIANPSPVERWVLGSSPSLSANIKRKCMKPTASFRLSKETKRSLALSKWTSLDQKHAWKRSMIQAELAASQPFRAPRQRNDGPKE